MKISTLLAVAVTVALLAALVGSYPTSNHAAEGTLPMTTASAAMEAWLATRGLIGHSRFGEQSSHGMMTPPAGVEVDETKQSVNQTGQVLMQVKSWNEAVGDDTVHIEVSTLSDHQYTVGFWLLPNHHAGCTMFQWTLFDNGRALQSRFWRNDARPHLTGSPDLPSYMYPDAVPWMAFLRVLDTPSEGAQGTLNQQLTPYNYVGQEVSVGKIQQLSVLAGSFSALKVTAQVDVATMMPNWPRFILHVIKPAVPKVTLYFESTAPFRLLKQEGPIFIGGPEVTTELVRYYTAQVEPVAPVAAASTNSLIAKP